ncbi:putative nuclease HARBI1 isoform X1 [Temnothorax longispinosus]|uniref:putative nuclease HARBI1 isoform X1 n=2 Tax=Temnothorax longispinosus TaxID=300112 RepID=UPI003A99CF5A
MMPQHLLNLLFSDDEDIVNVRPIRRRKRFKHRINYLEELDDIEFIMRFRISKRSVLSVLQHIREELEFATNKNKAISPMIQLLLTLRVYATGSFLISAGDFSGVSTTSAHYIVHRVSRAIARLRPLYIHFPNTEEEIRKEQQQFYKIARFPRVIGCIDCTHIRVQSFGGEDAELFRNRKGYFSINTQATCNSNLQITDIVARWQGSVHDSTIFNNSRLRANFENAAYGNGFLLGDSAYPSKRYLLTPLITPQTAAERLYNESHIRTRNIIERLFGVWKRRFPILALGMRYHLQRVMPIIIATAVLHNIARQNNDPQPDDDPNLDLPWDHMLAECNINQRINNDEVAGGTVRTELIHTYFANIRV